MRKDHDRLPLFDSQIPLQNDFRKTNPDNPLGLRCTHTNLPYKANLFTEGTAVKIKRRRE
jgi:hypothetical protein